MAPSVQSHQLLVWTLPPIAILLSFLWYKKKRSGYQSDPGDTGPKTAPEPLQTNEVRPINSVQDGKSENTFKATPLKIKRTLSGIESSPIDIIIPPNVKTNQPPPVISDSELDIEIEKVKSMKSPLFNGNCEARKRSTSSVQLEQAKSNTSPPTPKSSFTCEPKKILSNKMIQKKSKAKETLTSFPTKKMDVKPGCEVLNEIIETTTENMSKITIETCNKNEEISLNISGSGSDRQSSERDSANHSPVDIMMASPSLSSISDNQSEGSNDSGKGCSDIATQAGDGSLSGDLQETITTYEFTIHKSLVGRLVGANGNNIKKIKETANVNIVIKNYPEMKKTKICSIEGVQKEIDIALKLIRQKFPLKTHPSFTMEQVFIGPPHVITLIPECVYLRLIEAINNDTIVSHIESPIHLFLHQPTHPTYPTLNRLVEYMTTTYENSEAPLLPKPIQVGSICAASLNDVWYRVSILSTDLENDTSLVQFMDYGGYCNIENSLLRQIRADFIALPFQATECILANLRLKLDENGEIPFDANKIVADLTQGFPLQTQVVGFTPECIPLVNVYIVMGHGDIVFLNMTLAKAGIAEWIDDVEVCS